jgi:hypothetical protein
LECDSCFDGYLLNDQTKVCLNEQGFPVWAIVGCILLGGFAICIFFVKYFSCGCRSWIQNVGKKERKIFEKADKVIGDEFKLWD